MSQVSCSRKQQQQLDITGHCPWKSFDCQAGALAAWAYAATCAHPQSKALIAVALVWSRLPCEPALGDIRTPPRCLEPVQVNPGLVTRRRLYHIPQVNPKSHLDLHPLCETWTVSINICFPGKHQVPTDVTAGWAASPVDIRSHLNS